jgi:hypothetical protein
VYVVAWRERTLGIVGPLLLDREVPRQDVTVELEGEVAVGISIGGSPAWRSDQRLMLKATPRVGLRWIPAASVTAPLTLNTSSRIMLPAPGLWRIEVRAGDGDNSTVVAQRTVTIDAHRPNLLEFDLAARQYRGQVNAGTGEVNGTLSFTPEAPLVELARARVANGRFTVVLPTPGAYLGAFTSDDGSFVRSQVRVEVVDTEHAVVVALPTGTLAGTVVLPTGGAAPRATVTLKSRGAASAANASGSRQTTTDPSGGFSFQGLLDGTYELEASLQRSRAVPVVVTVQTAGMPQTVAPIPLREGGFFVRGRVTTANGEPLPGAAGTVVLESIDIGATPAVSTFTTDLLGYFRAALDRPARGWMHVTVATPGRAVTVFRIPAPPDNAPLLLQVSQFGGQCRLSLPAPTSTGRDLVVEADSYVLVNAAGARTSLAQLIDMRAALVIPGEHETTVVIPLLAVDTWKLESASAINAGQTFREEDPARPGTVRHFTFQPNTITKVTAR